eukprot:m.143933 g.143933  ORF g.143933 m.143933 type:complete len:74 (+) comp16031_c0_seq1:942-1163(+)
MWLPLLSSEAGFLSRLWKAKADQDSPRYHLQWQLKQVCLLLKKKQPDLFLTPFLENMAALKLPSAELLEESTL